MKIITNSSNYSTVCQKRVEISELSIIAAHMHEEVKLHTGSYMITYSLTQYYFLVVQSSDLSKVNF